MSIHDPALLMLLREKEARERDLRQSRLMGFRERLAHLKTQTEQLSSYRRHYQDHWQLQFKSGAQPAVLQCYCQFVERLDAALQQQTHTERHVQALIEQAKAACLEQEIRLAAIDKLMERRMRQLQSQEQRLQQRSDDEWAQRRARQEPQAVAAWGS